MTRNTIKKYTLAEMKDTYIGKIGSKSRTQYEYQLSMEVIGKLIRITRLERNLTQEELGKLIGVQKAQISKLENSANSASIATIVRIFQAMKAELNFNVKIDHHYIILNDL